MARAKTARNGNSTTKAARTVTQSPEVAEIRANFPNVDLESEIRRRAYELYEERGCTPGHEDEDWLVAERQVLSRYSMQSL